MLKKISVIIALLALSACAGTRQEPLAPSADADKQQIASFIVAGDATRDRGNFAEALRIYQEILLKDGTQTAAQYGIAECLLALGKPEEARPLFDALAAKPQYHAGAMQGTGLSLLAMGQTELAIKQLEDATKADPTLWRSWNALGELADLNGQPDEAAEHYARALKLHPKSPVILNNIGFSRLLANDPDQAIARLRQALALAPTSETIQANLRLALAAKGRYVEAARGTSTKNKPVVLNNIGYMAMQRGDYATAESYLTRAMQDSSSYNVVAAKNLEQLKVRMESSGK